MNGTDQDWKSTKSKLRIGDFLEVRILYCMPFGLLVVVDGNAAGVIERIGMEKDGYLLDQFEVGATIRACVIGFRDYCHPVELRLPGPRGHSRQE